MKKGLKLLSLLLITGMLASCGGNNPDPKPAPETWPKVYTVEKNETELKALMVKAVEDTTTNILKGFAVEGNLNKFEAKFDLGVLGEALEMPSIDVAMSGGFEAGYAVKDGATLIKDIGLGVKMNDAQITSTVKIGDVTIPEVMQKASFEAYFQDYKMYTDLSNANFVSSFEDGLKLIGLKDNEAIKSLAQEVCIKQVNDFADFLPTVKYAELLEMPIPSITVDKEKLTEIISSFVDGLKESEMGSVLTAVVNEDLSSELSVEVTTDLRDKLLDLFLDAETKEALKTVLDQLITNATLKFVMNKDQKLENISIKTNIGIESETVVKVKLVIDASFNFKYDGYKLPDLTGFEKNPSLENATAYKTLFASFLGSLDTFGINSKLKDFSFRLGSYSKVDSYNMETYELEEGEFEKDYSFELVGNFFNSINAKYLMDATKPTEFFADSAMNSVYLNGNTLQDSNFYSSILYDGDRVYIRKDTNWATNISSILSAIPEQLLEKIGLDGIAQGVAMMLGMFGDKCYGKGFEDVNLKIPAALIQILAASIEDCYFNILAMVTAPFLSMDINAAAGTAKFSIDIDWELTDELKALYNTAAPTLIYEGFVGFGDNGENEFELDVDVNMNNIAVSPKITSIDFNSFKLDLDMINVSYSMLDDFQYVTTAEQYIGLEFNGALAFTYGEDVEIPTLTQEEKGEYTENTVLTSLLTSLAEQIGKRTTQVDVTLPYI